MPYFYGTGTKLKGKNMNLRKEWYEQELHDNEEFVAHRPLEEEYSFYHAVSSGDMDYVQENCQQDTLQTLRVWEYFHQTG